MSDNLVPESETNDLVAKMFAREAERALANSDMVEYQKLMDKFKKHKEVAKAAKEKRQ